jgi:hypothetical protein
MYWILCNARHFSLPCLLMVVLLLGAPRSWAQADRIQFNGQNLFLNGLNLAWGEYPGGGASFANDIGPNASTPNLSHFTDVFSQMQANGGNAMRLWLHTTGENSPAWSGWNVTGPGTDTIADLETILDLAWEHDVGMVLCLWSFDMLVNTRPASVTDRSHAILTNETYRATYITNALIPMVQALQGHPAIIAWEIFNEPEGMSDEHGWSHTHHIPMADIQAFINQCAGAIHRTDPAAKVSNGSWAFIASSDVDGNFNYYSDARLIAAGGDPDGTLDFYMVHYYDWAGTALSPFQHPAAYWGLDKPLVIAEFFADCSNCTPGPYETLYQNGYAGALAWSWTDSSHSLMLGQIAATSSAHPGDVLIQQAGAPTVAITSPTNGAVFSAGATVSITAVATDTNGTITKVEFFQGAVKLGEDTTAPYQYDWVSPPTSVYTLSAVATDNDLMTTTSSGVEITVGIPLPPSRLEAEDAVFAGSVSVGFDAAASGGQYLDMAGNASRDTITWSVNNVPAGGTYDMTIGFNLAYNSPKTQNLTVNGTPRPAIQFSGAQDDWLELTVPVPLNAGSNVVQMTAFWGYMFFDYVEFAFPPPNTAPLLTPIADQTINPGVTLVLTNSASDAEAPPQTLTFNMLSGPSNAVLNAFSGVFTWRPVLSQGGMDHAVSVKVSDDGTPSLGATNNFTVTVNAATQPVLSAINPVGGQVSLTINGMEGPDYTLLTSTNLINWQVLTATNSPSLPVILVDPNPPVDPARYYIIRLGP